MVIGTLIFSWLLGTNIMAPDPYAIEFANERFPVIAFYAPGEDIPKITATDTDFRGVVDGVTTECLILQFNDKQIMAECPPLPAGLYMIRASNKFGMSSQWISVEHRDSNSEARKKRAHSLFLKERDQW